jgi:beta-galactosidase
MQRRDFMKRTGIAIAGLLAESAFAESSGLSSAREVDGRLVFPMNRNWLFSRSTVADGHMKDFDDSKFERVVIPHTNTRLPWHSFDDKEYEFVSVYRRHFKVPPGARGGHVFVDFEGVMTASTIWLNGIRLGEYKGGYTPFSFELTPYLDFDSDNVLAVEVDSTERADIPPFGHQIDYLTFGGIYREVALRVVPGTFIENIFAMPKDVLTANPTLEVECFLQHLEPSHEGLSLEVTLRDGDRVLGKGTQRVAAAAAANDPVPHVVRLENLGPVALWDLARPKLYSVHVRLLNGSRLVDEDSRARPSSNFSLCRPSHAGTRAEARCADPSQQFQMQHGAHLALSSIAAFSGCMRRTWPSSVGGNSGLAAHRRRSVEGYFGGQRSPHDSPRLESPFDRSLGSPHQRIPGRS